MCKRKKIIKMTWKEFLYFYDFSNWKIFNGEKHENYNCIVTCYNILNLLSYCEIKYNVKTHIFNLKIPIEITDWDNNIEFYLVYIWNEKKKYYESDMSCFLDRKEAENFAKRLNRDKDDRKSL